MCMGETRKYTYPPIIVSCSSKCKFDCCNGWWGAARINVYWLNETKHVSKLLWDCFYAIYLQILFFISLNFKLRYLTMLVGESTAQYWWFTIRSIPWCSRGNGCVGVCAGPCGWCRLLQHYFEHVKSYLANF